MFACFHAKYNIELNELVLIYCHGYRNRDTGISDISNWAKEGPYFESHAVVSAKRLKSMNRHAPSVQLPVAVSVAMVVCNVSWIRIFSVFFCNYLNYYPYIVELLNHNDVEKSVYAIMIETI